MLRVAAGLMVRRVSALQRVALKRALERRVQGAIAVGVGVGIEPAADAAARHPQERDADRLARPHGGLPDRPGIARGTAQTDHPWVPHYVPLPRILPPPHL